MDSPSTLYEDYKVFQLFLPNFSFNVNFPFPCFDTVQPASLTQALCDFLVEGVEVYRLSLLTSLVLSPRLCSLT